MNNICCHGIPVAQINLYVSRQNLLRTRKLCRVTYGGIKNFLSEREKKLTPQARYPAKFVDSLQARPVRSDQLPTKSTTRGRSEKQC